jgi:hypothetical protein
VFRIDRNTDRKLQLSRGVEVLAVESFKNQYRINAERFRELIEQDYKVTILGGEDEI